MNLGRSIRYKPAVIFGFLSFVFLIFQVSRISTNSVELFPQDQPFVRYKFYLHFLYLVEFRRYRFLMREIIWQEPAYPGTLDELGVEVDRWPFDKKLESKVLSFSDQCPNPECSRRILKTAVFKMHPHAPTTTQHRTTRGSAWPHVSSRATVAAAGWRAGLSGPAALARRPGEPVGLLGPPSPRAGPAPRRSSERIICLLTTLKRCQITLAARVQWGDVADEATIRAPSSAHLPAPHLHCRPPPPAGSPLPFLCLVSPLLPLSTRRRRQVPLSSFFELPP